MRDPKIEEDVEEIRRRLRAKGVTFEDRRVLITGGAGFLGSWICDVLIKDGAKVWCLDNFASGLKSNISHLLSHKNFRLIEHDVSQPIPLKEKFDFVIHAASRASPFELEKFPIEIIKANTRGTENALEIARKSGAKFLFTSTSEVYGDPLVVPTPETYTGNVDPVGPRSAYEESKRTGEALARAYLKEFNVDVRISRIFNTYGPRMRADGIYGRVVPRFIAQALTGKPLTVFGDGSQTRSFVYVADEIEGLLLLLTSEKAKGEVVNIGNNEEIRILDLAEIVKKITGAALDVSFAPLPPGDPKRRCPDITKARKLLGWSPRTSLEKGLSKTAEWFKAYIAPQV
ncbi:MAG: UDP-glucuronic acid decarboxylase family protein [Candidatus Hadarchaeales archaeon]